jgi:2-polyprenyl-3-methyl-5-hydroxy-6-metoxy-1,4-benzoquinol methylase
MEAYSAKEGEYFSNARRDYVAELPLSTDAKILEVGCGDGSTGVLALQEKKCSVYCGVELSPSVAERARGRITQVVAGDVEKLELPWPPGTFDVLILSEVLEHFVDPWTVLEKLRPLMKSGGTVLASSPNVSHYRILLMLFRGNWVLTDSGLMDRTHLRWFTPISYRELFESTGFQVDLVRELTPLTRKSCVANLLTLGCLKHLFIVQIDLRAHCT